MVRPVVTAAPENFSVDCSKIPSPKISNIDVEFIGTIILLVRRYVPEGKKNARSGCLRPS